MAILLTLGLLLFGLAAEWFDCTVEKTTKGGRSVKRLNSTGLMISIMVILMACAAWSIEALDQKSSNELALNNHELTKELDIKSAKIMEYQQYCARIAQYEAELEEREAYASQTCDGIRATFNDTDDLLDATDRAVSSVGALISCTIKNFNGDDAASSPSYLPMVETVWDSAELLCSKLRDLVELSRVGLDEVLGVKTRDFGRDTLGAVTELENYLGEISARMDSEPSGQSALAVYSGVKTTLGKLRGARRADEHRAIDDVRLSLKVWRSRQVMAIQRAPG